MDASVAFAGKRTGDPHLTAELVKDGGSVESKSATLAEGGIYLRSRVASTTVILL